MKKSEEQLLGFIDEYYIDNPAMGSGNIDIAIRDLLTDLMHVALDNGVDIRVRFEDAATVYQEELDYKSMTEH
jgi:hypothetical protein